MRKYYIKLDHGRCISCKACEAHCKNKNKVPEGLAFCVHTTTGPFETPEGPRYKTHFRPCYHCEKPACVEVCPTSAMIKREEDGIVYVDEDLCIGCQACVDACPWHVPQFNTDTDKAMKCDYCRDRLERGLDPACVTACTGHALTFVRK